MKKCPYCAEEIQDEALVCRYCRRELVTRPVQIPTPPHKKHKSHLALWLILALVGVCMIAGLMVVINAIKNGGGGGGGGTGGVATVGATVYAKDLVKLISSSLSCSTDYGIMTIKGKVQNLSSVYDLQFVEIRGSVTKEDGTIVNTNISFIDSDVLYRNSTSTFSVMVNDPNDEGTRCNAQIEDARFK